MKVIGNFLKDLFLGKKIVTVAQPRLGHTPKEAIVFPETYKPVSLYSNIPERQESSPSGSMFGSSILNLSAQQRDDAIFAQCMSGNIPNWMRNFKPITVTDNFGNTLTYFVSPDVLCIGNEYDFLRVSLNGYTARRVVDAFGCMLPTRRMSDQIWQHADLKMMPTGMGASYHMASTKTLMDHNAVIEKQRAGRNFNVITGHKKDIIFHSQLLKYIHNICIYGFHYPNGKPIQGAQYEAHNIWYQDYSHSIRLVSRQAILNNQSVDLMQLLNDKKFAHLISTEGAYDASLIYKR
jgi:hypothetical protein